HGCSCSVSQSRDNRSQSMAVKFTQRGKLFFVYS
ncbi:hypothetical protein Hypma_013578, partial [Hypsizygus marmoreus]